jgi:hypothetical protein
MKRRGPGSEREVMLIDGGESGLSSREISARCEAPMPKLVADGGRWRPDDARRAWRIDPCPRNWGHSSFSSGLRSDAADRRSYVAISEPTSRWRSGAGKDWLLR